jgi:orotate phosphoribosyltransferase
MSQVKIMINPDNPLATLRQCGGYYICPKDGDGKRLGPLVGYAGKYEDTSGNQKQYVGEVYYNFAKAEEHPIVLDLFAALIVQKMHQVIANVDYILGAPMGGIAIAFTIARTLETRFGFAEKKIISLATEMGREESMLVMNRHEIPAGAKVAIGEDVCNNLSTPGKLIKSIEEAGADLVAICCELNRSEFAKWKGIPIVSMLHIPTAQYRQDDAYVSEDIARRNIVWKPKNEWEKLNIKI